MAPPKYPNGAGESDASTEERLLDLLTKSLEKQEKAISKMDTNLCARLDTIDDSVQKLNGEMSGLQVVPTLLKVLALALALVGAAMGIKVGVDIAGLGVQVDPPIAAPPPP